MGALPDHARVDDVFGLVNQHQKAQAGGGGLRRDGQRDDGDHGVAKQVAHDGDQTGHESQRDQGRGVGQALAPQRHQEHQEDGGQRRVECGNPDLRGDDLPKGLAKVPQARGQCQGQGAAVRRQGPHGSQRANQQAHVSVEQSAQPGAPRHGKGTGLGGQVAGNGALNGIGAIGQMRRHVGRELVAQFEHGARHVVQQFAVLLRRINDVATRMGDAKNQHTQGYQHHQRGGQHLRAAWL